MSKEGTPEITKSWVFVDSAKKIDEEEKELKDRSGVEEVTENETHLDSDTDSISVISESGCSYKTDEEEFIPITTIEKEEKEEIEADYREVKDEETPIEEKEPEVVENEEILNQQPSASIDTNKATEKLLYFATSAVCAIILIGLSVAVQQYLQGASDVNNFDSNQEFVFPRVQNMKNEESPPRKLNAKRKNHFKLDELENKIVKLQEDNEFHDKIIPSLRDNDLREEGNLKSNYKLNKNKSPAAKCNKENCDVTKKHDYEKIRSDETDKNAKKSSNDEAYTEKIKELKVREDYLKEKEKFLIEKEHDLLKQEIKFKKERQGRTKHDKKAYSKKGKEHMEEETGEWGKRYKNKGNSDPMNNKIYKNKEEKKYSPQKRFRFLNEQDKKRNISGQWYINLHEARNNMRQKKRAHFKRNKAHWYFQWMVDRARLRVK